MVSREDVEVVYFVCWMSIPHRTIIRSGDGDVPLLPQNFLLGRNYVTLQYSINEEADREADRVTDTSYIF